MYEDAITFGGNREGDCFIIFYFIIIGIFDWLEEHSSGFVNIHLLFIGGQAFSSFFISWLAILTREFRSEYLFNMLVPSA